MRMNGTDLCLFDISTCNVFVLGRRWRKEWSWQLMKVTRQLGSWWRHHRKLICICCDLHLANGGEQGESYSMASFWSFSLWDLLRIARHPTLLLLLLAITTSKAMWSSWIGIRHVGCAVIQIWCGAHMHIVHYIPGVWHRQTNTHTMYAR